MFKNYIIINMFKGRYDYDSESSQEYQWIEIIKIEPSRNGDFRS